MVVADTPASSRKASIVPLAIPRALAANSGKAVASADRALKSGALFMESDASAKVRSAGTCSPSTDTSLLPVPRRPMTDQFSWMVAAPMGSDIIRSSGRPSLL